MPARDRTIRGSAKSGSKRGAAAPPASPRTAMGDVHVFVTDLAAALRFWESGLGLRLRHREATQTSGFAILEFRGGGPSLRLFGGAAAWPDGARPEAGSRPTVRFDITTTDFDATLIRVIENGGRQLDPIESFEGQRVVTIADPDGNSYELIEVPK
jgi:predicted enzyme related to lactoylglutathione lyase